MSFLSIKDAPLKTTIVGDEKIPTGGYGDLAITTQQIKDFTALSFSNVDNTADLDKPVSNATQAALNLKANITYVDNALALKSDKTYVDDNLALKASKIYVDTELQKTASKTYVDNQLATKASTTYVDSINSQKANLSYVDSELALKSDITYVDDQLTLKADKATTLSGYGIADAYTKTQVDASVTAVAGGHKAYTTLALAQAAQASLPANTIVEVTNDPTTANNGTYQWNGTTLTKSAYDPLTQAKAYADGNTLFKPVDLVAGSDLNTLPSNGYFRVKANASTMLNLPELANGVVFNDMDSTGAQVQWYLAEPTNNLWFRSKWSGTWKSWKQVADTSRIIPITTQKTGAQTLASYEAQGIYNFASTATISDLPSDAPTGVGYTLKVEDYLSGGRFKLQKLRCDSSKTGLKWERSLDAQNHTVGAWVFDSRLHDAQVVASNLDASFRYRGAFSNVTISDYRSDGLYTFTTPTDKPSMASITSGLVDVKNWFSGSFVIQIWSTANKVEEQFIRLVRPTTVGEWVRIGGGTGSFFQDKNLVCFGDSITEFGTYPAQIATRLSLANGYNIGFGGTRWGKHDNALYNEMCMYRVADYIATDNLAGLMDAAIALRDSTYADDNTAAVARLQSINLATVDYVTIFYGTNDFQGLVPIGADTDITGDTFKGAINLSLDKLLTKYPNMKLLLVTPIWRARQVSGDGLESDANPNSLGLYLRDYVEAIKEMGKKYHVPVLDLYNNSGINKYTKTLYLSSDELHPNNAGYTHLANLIASKLSATY